MFFEEYNLYEAGDFGYHEWSKFPMAVHFVMVLSSHVKFLKYRLVKPNRLAHLMMVGTRVFIACHPSQTHEMRL